VVVKVVPNNIKMEKKENMHGDEVDNRRDMMNDMKLCVCFN